MLLLIGFILAILLILTNLAPTGFAAIQAGAEEASLPAAQKIYEINTDAQGKLYISDQYAGEIWRVDPATQAYTVYTAGSTVIDARPDNANRLWWSDYYNSFYAINLANNQLTRWDIPEGVDEFIDLSGTAIDPSGNLWLVDYNGTDSAFYRFIPATSELCKFSPPGGVTSYYIIYKGGYIWMSNWGANRLYRFDPLTNQLTAWNMGADGTPRGMDLDDSGKLWVADAKLGVLRLDPLNNYMTTYLLPISSQPKMLIVSTPSVWITGSTGTATLSELNPAAASGNQTTLTRTTQTVTPTCSSLTGTNLGTASTRSGNLTWSSSAVVELVNQSDWKVYQLPASGIPYGIASSGIIYTADQGRQTLMRWETTRNVYLPYLMRMGP